MTKHPVCNYEGSDYQVSFWDQGNRAYEDLTESIALKRLMPKGGRLLLELGAGAGRNTSRYVGFDRIVLLDYSITQLKQAQERLGKSGHFLFVAADIYRLPFQDGVFDAATMIRTLHHMADAPAALRQVRNVLQPNAAFILEYANKRHIKAILRYWLGKQEWNPFTPEPVEFVDLNFDFHPKTVASWLREAGFKTDKTLTVSHFRHALLKRYIPTALLVSLDAAAQWTGDLWQLTPSVFTRNRAVGGTGIAEHADTIFKCPGCGSASLSDKDTCLQCASCSKKWGLVEGIYDFREPV
ncbi:MAG: methyltransferase domain-containing protein [Anaerolineales bacterium]|nr:methyltransferase domain-containing protein [Anaerolineales bacterium]